MNLAYKTSGSGEPLIILHGLFGSGDNWYSVARELNDAYTVYLVDLRNHGHSPHHPVHTYDALAQDVRDFMNMHGIPAATFIGHSMGGKTALNFGIRNPHKVKKMVVVDISPLGFDKNDPVIARSDQFAIIKALNNLDTGKIASRSDADKALSPQIPSTMVRQFLLKSLKRLKDGSFRWSINIKALDEQISEIFEGIIAEEETDPRAIPEFPLLFIKGERSAYIGEEDVAAINHYFPWAEIKVISGAGHWVHAEQQDVFVRTVREFFGIM